MLTDVFHCVSANVQITDKTSVMTSAMTSERETWGRIQSIHCIQHIILYHIIAYLQ
jgi:hypothetical protein